MPHPRKTISDVLTPIEVDAVIAWFLFRLDADKRRILMADLPVAYAAMFPDVEAGPILDAVRARIEDQREGTP